MKLYTEQNLIDLVESLKNYTHESHNILGHDERDAKEFVDIFIRDIQLIKLPSDEEIEDVSGGDVSFELGAQWLRNKIQNGNNE